jgi:hypothetical protein
VDEEEDEVGEVAFAGKDAFWVGHSVLFSFLFFWAAWLTVIAESRPWVDPSNLNLSSGLHSQGEFGKARAGIKDPIGACVVSTETSGCTYQDGGARVSQLCLPFHPGEFHLQYPILATYIRHDPLRTTGDGESVLVPWGSVPFS